ncbi:YeeE/YedE family protein, partial [bacterium]|nr:YeeE/YedE family protein [bacterium]
MKNSILTFLAGAFFGAGLALSGMTDPLKVVAFLDIFGFWDPTLAFVMGGALLVFGGGYFLLRG